MGSDNLGSGSNSFLCFCVEIVSLCARKHTGKRDWIVSKHEQREVYEK